jgi:hypothetical protein
MHILGIDPGSEQSAWVLYDSSANSVLAHRIEDNEALLLTLRHWCENFPLPDAVALEMVASYGMPVGKSVFQTCVWIGRFVQIVDYALGLRTTLIYRLDAKMTLCHDSRAKDSNIRQAVLDLFPATGGGAIPQVGTKQQPGPLYGMSKDMWSALAVALTDAKREKQRRTQQCQRRNKRIGIC